MGKAVLRGVRPSARTVALSVLLRVEEDAAFAAAVLDDELDSNVQLSPADRALATELAYGVLRSRVWLLGKLNSHAKNPVESANPIVRNALLIGAYQLFLLDRIPPFAAVNESVEIVRRAVAEPPANFVNAILRRCAKDAEAGKPDPGEVFRASVPAWLRDAVGRAIPENSDAYFAHSSAPRLSVVVYDASARDEWVTRFRQNAPTARVVPAALSPHGILIEAAGDYKKLPGFGDRAWGIQEEGSQLVALALGATSGEIVLDACAGRGHKAALFAKRVEAIAAPLTFDMVDLYPEKLEQAAREQARIGLHPRNAFAIDWTKGDGGLTPEYDAILVDAPCTGTGTMHRRPDLLLRRTKKDLAELPSLQTDILSRVVTLLKPGGRLVYAVCSPLVEESEEVLARVTNAHPELVPMPFRGEPARTLAGDGTTLRLLPQAHGTDGYFLASFCRVE